MSIDWLVLAIPFVCYIALLLYALHTFTRRHK